MKHKTKIINWRYALSLAGTVVIPLFYFFMIALVFFYPHTFNPPVSVAVLGVFIAFFGVTLWILSYIHLREAFGVLPEKRKRVTRGVYKYLHHPMYVGIWCSFLGLSLANESWEGLFFLTVFITPLLFIRSVFEERQLID